MAASPDYRFFAPLDRDYFIFDLVKPDISLLPEASIREVVRFYDEMGAFDALLASFQDSRFESFPAERRMTYIGSMTRAAADVVAADVRKAEDAMLELKSQTSVSGSGGRALFSVVSSLNAAATVGSPLQGPDGSGPRAQVWIRPAG